ncbi:MAG: hypothetical protein OCU16_07290 [Candidatus Methanospirare jalkutatii]|nr:hypothetical protein [Candidatus Methanospirare jalkutatii]
MEADPGVSLDITPINDKVLPGETASYKVNVTSQVDMKETVHLNITNPIPGWNYTFSDNDFNLPAYSSKTVDMFITVAPNASPGNYYHDVKAEGLWDHWTVEETVYTNVLTTVIPEFSTIAIPAAAIFVMLFFIRRRA